MEWTGVGGGEAAVEPVLVVQAGEKVLTGTQSWGGVGHGMEGNWGDSGSLQGCQPLPLPPLAPARPSSTISGALALRLARLVSPGK